MASAEEIKARIGSIRQTKKVTDAMYMISSVKMRRAKREVISTEPYFNALKEQISDLFLYIPETATSAFCFPKDRLFAAGDCCLSLPIRDLRAVTIKPQFVPPKIMLRFIRMQSSLLSANAEDTIALTTAYALLRSSTTQRHSRQFGKHAIYVMIC